MFLNKPVCGVIFKVVLRNEGLQFYDFNALGGITFA